MAMLLVSWYWYGTITSFRRIGVRQTDCSLVTEDRLIAKGRRTHPEESPNSICGWTSSFLLGRGPDCSTRPVAPRAFPGGLTR